MKEKELRIALVCYGGVSLVLYMHGTIKEFLKVLRASKAYHALPDASERQAHTFESAAGPSDRVHDTEHVYFDLIKAIGKDLNLKIVIDSIAGASAGGISGIVLARALAHDLSIDHLRDLWLNEADVMRLIHSSQRARPWSKWFLRPLLWMMFRFRRLGSAFDKEIQNNLSVVLRSRWFHPPFDGDHFLELLFDGLNSMKPEKKERSSLLPDGHGLDLAVSVTDFFGYPRDVRIRSPSVISERQHALLWTFRYDGQPGGVSEFDDAHVPGLAFAARATSNFPGAFPPAQLADLDRLLARRKQNWMLRDTFMSGKFPEHIAAGIDPANVALVDGSVVNNKPFAAVLDMVRSRPAYRDVDRRLVYIEPDPTPTGPRRDQVPNFLETLEGTILEIPMQAPIFRELSQVEASNRMIKRTRDILNGAYPELAGFVKTIMAAPLPTGSAEDNVKAWRERANTAAAKEAGYAYQVYARLKTLAVVDFVAELICSLGNTPKASRPGEKLLKRVRAWADRRGAIPPDGALGPAQDADASPWILFLRHADAPFRRRRLLFVMQGLNLIYGRLNETGMSDVEPRHVDLLKRRFQTALNRMGVLQSGAFASPELRKHARHLAEMLESEDSREPDVMAEKSFNDEMERLLKRIDLELDLASVDRDVDGIIASSMGADIPDALARELAVFYFGFPFWDVWTYPMNEWQVREEHRETRIDRISPADASLLHNGTGTRLKGAELKHFAGFLSRSRREHDYLWGRLHGAERLIDIVADAARIEDALGGVDILGFKLRAFKAILDTEEHHLKDKDLLAAVRAQLDRLHPTVHSASDSPSTDASMHT